MELETDVCISICNCIKKYFYTPKNDTVAKKKILHNYG